MAVHTARVAMTNAPARSRSRSYVPVVTGLLAGISLLFFVSPQVQSLRLNGLLFPGVYYAVLGAALLCADASRRGVLKRIATRHAVTFALIVAFAIQAGARFWGVNFDSIGLPDGTAFVHQYTVELFLLIPVLLLVGAVAEIGGVALDTMRGVIVIGWPVSLALGIPLLWSEPNIARTTMGAGAESAEYFRILSPFGIGNYLHYTPFALLFPVLVKRVVEYRPSARAVALLALAGAGCATLLSTFTMATVVLAYGVVVVLAGWAISPRGLHRRLARAGIAVATGVALWLGVDAAAHASMQVEFVVEKTERLVSGISGSGLASGDETGRGAWFVESLTYLADENPVLGFVDGLTRFAAHNHSSLMDTFVVFGVIGFAWLAILWRLYKWSMRGVNGKVDALVVRGAYIGLVLSGAMNPTWYSLPFLIPLVALTLHASEPDSPISSMERVAA